jgi:cardiolipin synthase
MLAAATTACSYFHTPEVVPEMALEDPAFLRTLEAYAEAPVVPGNAVEILANGDEIFPTQLTAIAAARRTITYSQYFWTEGAIADALVQALSERCRAGVGVEVLLDGFGALTMARASVERMRRAGCAVEFFRPMTDVLSGRIDHRNHRRILVVDGRVGFTGGVGVSDKWAGNGRLAGHWRDTEVRVEGPVVRYLQAAFVESWQEATGILLRGDAYFPVLADAGDVTAQVITSSPVKGDFAIYTTLLLAITGARQSILITNPYFVPNEQMRDAVLAAAARGVRVVALVPGDIDSNVVRRVSRHSLGPLLRGGVEIYEYRASLLHAKTIVVDGTWAAVGTVNLDPRSFTLNAEVNVALYGRTVAARLETMFADDLRYARRLDYRRWRARPLWHRLLEILALPLAPEL